MGLPLLPNQRRLWYSIALEGSSPAHNITAVLYLEGCPQVPALHAALRDVVGRHEALRVVVTQDAAGAPVQRIGPPPGHILEHRVVTEAHLAELVAECADRPFDVATGPPVRALLLEQRPDRHVLVVTAHRLVADETSLEVIGRDLATAYRARTARRPPRWPSPAGSYADHVRRLHDVYGDGANTKYWTGRLAHPPGPPQLLSSTPNPTDSRAEFRTGAATHAAVRALANEQSTDVDVVVLAALVAMLSRSSGDTDILVGRSVNTGPAELVAPLDNILVLRVDTTDDPTIDQLVVRVRDIEREARAAELPLDLVVEALDPPPARAQLLPAVLVRGTDLGTSYALDGLTVAAAGPAGSSPRDGLTVTLTGPPAECLQGTLTLPSPAVGGNGAGNLADRLVRALAAFRPGSRRRLSEIEILSAEERGRLVDGFNATARDGCDHTMPALVEMQVRRTPDDLAVVSDEAALTYAELNARANRLAHHLIDLGIGPEDIVALALPRCVDATVAALGVVKAGAAYLPVDLVSPADRLAYIMADAAPKLVVVRGDHGADKLPAGPARIDLADPATCRRLDAQPSRDPTDRDRTHPLDLAHPAYVIYTSGSTGRPKGVVITHTGIESVIFSVIRGLRITRGSRVVQLASPSFDVVVWDTCCALFRGATLVVVSERQTALGPPFVDLVDRHRATHVTLSPTALDALPERDPRLRTLAVTVVGENCGEHVLRKWSAGRQFVNGYGPTEVTICATLSEPLTGSGKPTIGGPIDNVQVYVLNSALSPVPVGVVGELYVGGVGLARGYLGRPDLTAERFLPNPLGPAGSRMYRTGDLVRWRGNGLLDFVGRADAQVKIRGYRVELGEIESVLAGCPGVAQAAAVVLGEESWNRRLVAYVVPNGGGVEEDALRATARRLLPDYMNPSRYVHIDELPLTTSGKLDRRALEHLGDPL
jgi:amino acid adenylation domain-containing protein